MSRAENKRATLVRLQTTALELFNERGYDAVTSQEIASAAGVTERTFFRYFPTKDSAVLWYVDDEAPPELDDEERSSSAREVAEIRARWIIRGEADRRLLLSRMKLISSTPSLRAQWLDKNHRQALALAEALLAVRTDLDAFATRVVMSTVFAAACVAAEAWTSLNGRRPLDALLEEAFAACSEPALPSELPPAAGSWS